MRIEKGKDLNICGFFPPLAYKVIDGNARCFSLDFSNLRPAASTAN